MFLEITWLAYMERPPEQKLWGPFHALKRQPYGQALVSSESVMFDPGTPCRSL